MGVTMPVPVSTREVVPFEQTGAPAIGLKVEPNSFRLLLEEIVRTVIQELNTDRTQMINGKLAIDESEAAAYLGLNPWQLRDLRRDGKITHRRIVGNRVRYMLEDLKKYLARSIQPGT